MHSQCGDQLWRTVNGTRNVSHETPRRANMNDAESPRESVPASSVFGRMVKYVLKACVLGGIIGGFMGILFAVIGALVNPDSFRLGARNETGPELLMQIGEWALMFFLAWGMGGLIVGVIVGLLGCAFIALRR